MTENEKKLIEHIENLSRSGNTLTDRMGRYFKYKSQPDYTGLSEFDLGVSSKVLQQKLRDAQSFVCKLEAINQSKQQQPTSS